MPPMTAPPTVPTPLWLPAMVTGRIDNTVASWTDDMRCASYRLTTSGFAVWQAARVPSVAIAATMTICLNMRILRG